MVFTVTASVSAWRNFVAQFPKGVIVWRDNELVGDRYCLVPEPMCGCGEHPVFNVRDLVSNFTRYGQHELSCELEEFARNEGFNAIEVERSCMRHRSEYDTFQRLVKGGYYGKV